MTIREIVTDLLDNSPETVFSLWGLADTVGLRKGGGATGQNKMLVLQC